MCTLCWCVHNMIMNVIYPYSFIDGTYDFFIDGSSKATYNRILKMIQRSVKEANRVYNMAEFYGKGRTIHKGIKFELTDYYIDTDLNCNPPPEKHG